MPTIRAQGGQATVELVAVLPLLVVLGFGLWQAAVAGQAIWLAGAAARAAARAEALGADPIPAARDVLPPRLEDGLSVHARDGGAVTVTVRIPSVVGSGALASTSAEARFVPQTP
jgi:TadE-like protein